MGTFLVCGGRVGVIRKRVYRVLDALSPVMGNNPVIVHGDAQQTDQFAGAWGRRNGRERSYPIDNALDGHLRTAPKQRNVRMFRDSRPDAVIGFPGGPGTRHMMDFADTAGTVVWDVEIEENAFEVWQWPHAGNAKKFIVAGSFS